MRHNPTSKSPKPLLSVEEAAVLWGDRSHALPVHQRPHLPTPIFRIGQRIRIPRRSVERLLAGLPLIRRGRKRDSLHPSMWSRNQLECCRSSGAGSARDSIFPTERRLAGPPRAGVVLVPGILTSTSRASFASAPRRSPGRAQWRGMAQRVMCTFVATFPSTDRGAGVAHRIRVGDQSSGLQENRKGLPARGVNPMPSPTNAVQAAAA